MNYPDYNEASGFRPYTFNLDGNISQVIDINIDIAVSDDETDICTYLKGSISITIVEGKKGDPFYTQSYPNINEAVNSIIA